jgi:L-gulono-1,4-lactone dehydrogenase
LPRFAISVARFTFGELELDLANATITASEVTNFGGNVRFRPSAYLTPRTEAEVLRILEIHCGKRIRAVGKLHSWSEAPRADEILIDLRHFDHVRIEQDSDGISATVGAGCQIKRVLSELERLADATLPSIGLITEQTIAGATATGTHGSGKHSLSHYITEVRHATYDPVSNVPMIRVVRDGVALLAARCSLGCMGIVLSVKITCRPSYMVEEHIRRYTTLDEVLAAEADYPLQQFFLIPWSWRFIAQHRREVDKRRSRLAPLYRAYWFLGVDVALHLWIQLMVRWLRSSRLVRFYYRRILPQITPYGWTVVDNSQSMLTMEHELFQHIEIEMFVDRTRLHDAILLVQELLNCFDSSDAGLTERWHGPLARVGLLESLHQCAGTYTHHYPICIRRVLPDDTLISMASGECDPWYALSFISYARPNQRAGFMAFAKFLAKSMVTLFGARPHWGKVFPIDPILVAAAYPRFEEFRSVCAAFDPADVFTNQWTASLLRDTQAVRLHKNEGADSGAHLS